MKSNYEKLGPYICEVVEKNSQNQIEKLLGVSIQKCFIPSIANTIGTDMTTYKIVRENQFAYGPVTSRNGDKISVALLQESDCIISTSYTVFEIINHYDLLPEYLMMWFRRPEFDRYARFMSHGSVREIFGWEEMSNVELPIPHIDKQKEIIVEYNTIVNRIKLNEKLNQKLEETAQAIYKQWFVDFEFPDENGKPYKSSGGEMYYCTEMNAEIPIGWSSATISDTCEVINGRAYKESEFIETGTPIVRIQNLSGGEKYVYSDLKLPSKMYIENHDLIFAWSATFGPYIWRGPKSIYHYHIWKLKCFDYRNKFLLYYFLSLATKRVSSQGSGSIFSHITKTLIEEQRHISPTKDILSRYDMIMKIIDNNIEIIRREIDALGLLRTVLLSKMSRE
jgi:type I restriction enzyme S subunit